MLGGGGLGRVGGSIRRKESAGRKTSRLLSVENNEYSARITHRIPTGYYIIGKKRKSLVYNLMSLNFMLEVKESQWSILMHVMT